MITRVHLLLFVAAQGVFMLQAMDWSYAPSSSHKAEIHASHATIVLTTPYSNPTGQQVPQMPVQPVGFINNPIFNPTLSYNLLQLAQMQSARASSSGVSHSSQPEPLDSQLKAQLFSLQGQGDRQALRDRLATCKRQLATFFAPVNIQKIKAEIALIQSVLQDQHTDIFAQIKEAPINQAIGHVNQLYQQVRMFQCDPALYTKAYEILYARVDFHTTSAQQAYTARIQAHRTGNTAQLQKEHDSLTWALVHRTHSAEVTGILRTQLQDVQQRLEDTMLPLLHEITIAPTVQAAQAAYEQIVTADTNRPTTYKHGGSIKQGDPHHPDYFGFNAVVEAKALLAQRIEELSLVAPTTTAATGPGTTTTTYATMSVSQTTAGTIAQQSIVLESANTADTSVNQLLHDLVTTSPAHIPVDPIVQALMENKLAELAHKYPVGDPMLYIAALNDTLRSIQETNQLLEAGQLQELQATAISQLPESLQRSLLQLRCACYLAYGVGEQLADIKGFVLSHVKLLKLACEILVAGDPEYIGVDRAELLGPDSELLKLETAIQAINKENINKVFDHISNMSPEEQCRVIGNIIGALLQGKILTGAIPSALKTVERISVVISEGRLAESIAQSAQKFAQGITTAEEAIATTAEGISVEVGATTAAQEVVLMQEANQGIRGMARALTSKEAANQIAAKSREILLRLRTPMESVAKGGNKIKEISDTSFKIGHTFSEEHIKDGILQIGSGIEKGEILNNIDLVKRVEEIALECIDLIKQVDALDLFVEGTSVMQTYIDGLPFEIHVHIEKNMMLSFNAFADHSTRKVKNLIKIEQGQIWRIQQ